MWKTPRSDLRGRRAIAAFALTLAMLGFAPSCGESPSQPTKPPVAARETASPVIPDLDLASMTRPSPADEVWFDRKTGRVWVGGEIVLRERPESPLEMFAATKGIKDYESVVGVRAKASVIHTALLMVGAEPGHPVSYRPDYVAASGPEIEILARWKDADGKNHEVPAQQWLRDASTKGPMAAHWVFGGSYFWKDDMGKEHYEADYSGDLICVSNNPGAMLDLPIQSAYAERMFEPFTENIPPLKTEIKLVLIPKLPKTSDGKHD